MSWTGITVLKDAAAAQPPIDVRPRQPSPEEQSEIHLAGFEEGCPPDFRLESMTDVGFTLKVTWLDDPCLDDIVDPPVGGCNVRTYVQAPGENRNVQDVEAFRFEE